MTPRFESVKISTIKHQWSLFLCMMIPTWVSSGMFRDLFHFSSRCHSHQYLRLHPGKKARKMVKVMSQLFHFSTWPLNWPACGEGGALTMVTSITVLTDEWLLILILLFLDNVKHGPEPWVQVDNLLLLFISTMDVDQSRGDIKWAPWTSICHRK